jgi:hypothetical protein
MAWPTSIAGNGDLYEAKNNISTTLNGAIDNVTTTVVLTDASAFPASGFVTIGTEAISYTSKTGNSLNGVVRGADGTTAASHLNGSGASHYVVAAHHNALKDEVIAVETQLAAEMTATKEPTGFPDASTTTISVVDGTRTFTIAPTGASFEVYVAGTKFTKTSESVTFTDTEGVWYFSYDSTGTLTASQTPWSFDGVAQVALLYWDATNNVSLDLADERHGCAMDWATHQYLHSTVGTRFVSGLAASGYVLNSAVNADVRFAFSSGAISDEDLLISIAAQTEPAQIPVFYRAGATGLWKRAAATDYPYLTTGTGRIAYNLDTAGTWSQAEVSSGDFAAYWIFATDGKNYPIISIQGQRQDTSLANAKNNNLYESLSFGSLPYAEMKLLFRVIVQTSNAYGSTMKVRVVDVQDLRSVSNLPSGSYVASAHGSLTGRSDAGSHPATAISNTPAGNIAATDVQSAIDELDTEKAAAGAVTSSGLTMATAKLLGRSTAATGAIEEITVGSGLTLSAGSLSATASGSGTVNSSASADRVAIYRAAGTTVDSTWDADHYLKFNGALLQLVDLTPGQFCAMEVSGTGQVAFIASSVGGDAATYYQVTGTTFIEGVDYADSSKYKLGKSDFGTDDLMEVTTAGLFNLVKTGSAAAPVLTVGDDADTGIWAPAANTWAVSTAGTERIRIDSSGNVGIGGSPGYKLDVNDAGGNDHININGTSAGTVAIRMAPSGSSSNTAKIIATLNGTQTDLSFRTGGSDRVTVLNTGEVGIGVAPESTYILKTSGTINPTNVGDDDAVSIKGTSAGYTALAMQHYGSSAAVRLKAIADGANSAFTVTTGAVERLRVKADGKVGVGVTPTANLHVKGANAGQFILDNDGSQYVQQLFQIGGASNSGADFLYDSTTPKFMVRTLAVAPLVFSTSATAGSPVEALRIDTSGAITAPGVYNSTTASAANVYVASGGLLSRSTSSLRYKTNIVDVPLEDAQKLLDVTPITYASLCAGDDKEARHYGFIAEELDLVDPVLVSYKTLEDGTKVPDGVQYERVVVGLLKLVQDLTKRVTDLEAKVAKPCMEPSTTTVDNTTPAADSTSSSL